MAAKETHPLNLPRPVGRLAPSPTGILHLGNARTFLLAWLSIRSRQGTVLLRMEDIDTARVRPGATQAVVNDLQWLGLDWDFGPDLANGCLAGIPMRQSQRFPRYRQVLKRLIDEHAVYPCDCSRSQIASNIASAPHESNRVLLEGPIYPGTCRKRWQESSTKSYEFSATERPALRWALKPGSMQWRDHLLGEQVANPLEQLGDFVIGRGNGLPSYHLAVVVDDHDMGVTEVVRGDDLVLSTFRQQAILGHLGWSSPDYCHVPLVVGPDGQRLAKRSGDSLMHLRKQDVSPQQLVGYLAFSSGLIDRPERVGATDLVSHFEWSKLNRQPFQVPENWTDSVQP